MNKPKRVFDSNSIEMCMSKSTYDVLNGVIEKLFSTSDLEKIMAVKKPTSISIKNIPNPYMDYKGVSIGDRFKRNKSIFTVVDFYITRNMAGDIVDSKVVAETEYMKQKLRSEFPFATVKLNKID